MEEERMDGVSCHRRGRPIMQALLAQHGLQRGCRCTARRIYIRSTPRTALAPFPPPLQSTYTWATTTASSSSRHADIASPAESKRTPATPPARRAHRRGMRAQQAPEGDRALRERCKQKRQTVRATRAVQSLCPGRNCRMRIWAPPKPSVI